MTSNDNGLMTFGGHLEVLRKMLFRIIGVALVFAILIFCAKDTTFSLLLAPCDNNFVTYRWIESIAHDMGINFSFAPFHVQLINIELSSQFMTHVSTAVYLALLFTSPYVVVELYRFIAPALYDNERRYSVVVSVAIYVLFMLGVLMSYYVLFPFALRFLGTYQVMPDVVNQINLSSYISTFTTLTLLMGLVFQIPVLSFFPCQDGHTFFPCQDGHTRAWLHEAISPSCLYTYSCCRRLHHPTRHLHMSSCYGANVCAVRD